MSLRVADPPQKGKVGNRCGRVIHILNLASRILRLMVSFAFDQRHVDVVPVEMYRSQR
jgi:hypothetical protein